MLPELFTHMEQSLLPAVFLLAGLFAGMALERGLGRMRRRAWREKNPRRWEQQGSRRNTDFGPWVPPIVPASLKPLDATEQLRIVMRAEFTTQPLLNRKEARVFKELDRVVIGCNPGWQVMAQVSLGEILRSRDAGAFSCINSKRVDLLLVDEKCRPRHAVEYQGAAHHQGAAAARDAVKKEALRRAGVGYHEVVAGHTTPADLRRLVEKLVEKPATAR